MKKVILGAVLFTLSGSVLSSSLQDQLAAVAQAEQQGKK
ncbi:Hydrocephalus-inducing protein Hy-3 [Salmonella enterica subsp. enterica]|uniref:Hydrocephalus-inducing protein Hy-3 n=1 Tax=Salmonella enterica I TaxID=59201 RepID=A0A379WP90_SALET|nr:Hydrocephalus-inducing protein Hy-3 [Salmonella enterica subsp. enterica]